MDHHASEQGLVNGLKNADVEAWRTLYAQFGGMIYRLARGMVGAKEADDVTQETLLKAFRKRDQFRGESLKELECWLYRIALNKCRDWCRSRLTEPVFVAVTDWTSIGSDQAPVEDRVDDVDLLQEGLQGVTPELRALLLLHMAGRSYREIGSILKIKSKATVAERMGLARQQLQQSLARLGWSA